MRSASKTPSRPVAKRINTGDRPVGDFPPGLEEKRAQFAPRGRRDRISIILKAHFADEFFILLRPALRVDIQGEISHGVEDEKWMSEAV